MVWEADGAVITSYSIHYTKLYESLDRFRILIGKYSTESHVKWITIGHSGNLEYDINGLILKGGYFVFPCFSYNFV